MKEITMSQLADLLKKSLKTDSMGGSEIFLLKKDFRSVKAGRGISLRKAEELNKTRFSYGLPEGELNLPIQYTTGLYPDINGDYTHINQGLATVFHPDFYEGKTIMTDEELLYRPLVDGYLDSNKSVLNDYMDIESSDFKKAWEFRESLWIGNEKENNAENIIRKHINDFLKLYELRKFLKDPASELIDKSFR
jgi:hypothetical protein